MFRPVPFRLSSHPHKSTFDKISLYLYIVCFPLSAISSKHTEIYFEVFLFSVQLNRLRKKEGFDKQGAVGRLCAGQPKKQISSDKETRGSLLDRQSLVSISLRILCIKTCHVFLFTRAVGACACDRVRACSWRKGNASGRQTCDHIELQICLYLDAAAVFFLISTVCLSVGASLK